MHRRLLINMTLGMDFSEVTFSHFEWESTTTRYERPLTEPARSRYIRGHGAVGQVPYWHLEYLYPPHANMRFFLQLISCDFHLYVRYGTAVLKV